MIINSNWQDVKILFMYIMLPYQRYILSSALDALEFKGICIVVGPSAQNITRSLLTKSRPLLLIRIKTIHHRLFLSLISYVATLTSRVLKRFKKPLLFLKSTTYHLPQLSNRYCDIGYVGDGFGILALPTGISPSWIPKTLSHTDFLFNPPLNFCLTSINYFDCHAPSSITSVELNQSLINLVRQKLLSFATKYSDATFKVNQLTCFTDIVFLNNLGGLRVDQNQEANLVIEYIMSFVDKPKPYSVLLVPHPSKRDNIAYINNMAQFIDNVIGIPDSCHILHQHSSFLADFSALASEELISLFCLQLEQKRGSNICIHTFQSSIFTLSALFPDFQYKFGFGSFLIGKYFFENAAKKQLYFEESVRSHLHI